jgi:hypothetical protein
MSTEFPLSISMKKEYCWMLSNLAAGTEAQVNVLFDSKILRHVKTYLLQDQLIPAHVLSEIAWIAGNAAETVHDQENFTEFFECFVPGIAQQALLIDYESNTAITEKKAIKMASEAFVVWRQGNAQCSGLADTLLAEFAIDNPTLYEMFIDLQPSLSAPLDEWGFV